MNATVIQKHLYVILLQPFLLTIDLGAATYNSSLNRFSALKPPSSRRQGRGDLQVCEKPHQFRAVFWEGDATKHISVKKKGFFSEKGGGNSVNQAFGKDFYRKGNSVNRFGPFIEPPDSEN